MCVSPPIAQSGASGGYSAGAGDDLHRRSLYTFRKRTVPPPTMLVFDGGSFALNGDCSLAAQLPAFQACVTTITLVRSNGEWQIEDAPKALAPEGDEADYLACMIGLRDYVDKNSFPSVILGLSGGIDSTAIEKPPSPTPSGQFSEARQLSSTSTMPVPGLTACRNSPRRRSTRI
jgi:hypothetical protein